MKSKFFLLLVFMAAFGSVTAQTEQERITKVILFKDSLFWLGYNNCDMGQMKQFIADDIEFYHDKGGITLGIKDLMTSLQNNICGSDKNKIRREAVPGTVKLFILKNSDTIYGAIVSGDHFFYGTEKGKKETLNGLAKFTNLWILKDNQWKMSRILSYDHGPAPYINKRTAIKMTAKALTQFAGQYLAPNAGICKVQRENDLLLLSIGDQKYVLYPESDSRFFVKDRDLTFEFVKNEKGKISKMIVREHGEIVEEAVNKN